MRGLTIAIGLLTTASPAPAVLQIWEGGTGGMAALQREVSPELSIPEARISFTGFGLDQMHGGEGWTVEVSLRIVPRNPPYDLAFAIPYQTRIANWEVNPPRGEKPAVGEPLIFGFELRRDGRPLAAATVPLKPTWGLPAEGFTFGWGAETSLEGPVTVTYRFRTGVTTHESGARWAKLALGPAASWGGVEKLSVEVRPAVKARRCSELMREEPEFYPFLEGNRDTPAGWKGGGAGTANRWNWEGKRVQGKEDLSLCFVTAVAHRRNLLNRLILRPSSFFQGQEKEALRILRNQVYAVYGRKFRDKKLKKHFESQWWYEPDEGFRYSRLSEGEKDLVRYLSKMERFAEN